MEFWPWWTTTLVERMSLNRSREGYEQGQQLGLPRPTDPDRRLETTTLEVKLIPHRNISDDQIRQRTLKMNVRTKIYFILVSLINYWYDLCIININRIWYVFLIQSLLNVWSFTFHLKFWKLFFYYSYIWLKYHIF